MYVRQSHPQPGMLRSGARLLHFHTHRRHVSKLSAKKKEDDSEPHACLQGCAAVHAQKLLLMHADQQEAAVVRADTMSVLSRYRD